jgi:hypothetical protein
MMMMMMMTVTVQSACRGARNKDYTTYRNIRTPFRTRTDIWPSVMFAKDVTEPTGCGWIL